MQLRYVTNNTGATIDFGGVVVPNGSQIDILFNEDFFSAINKIHQYQAGLVFHDVQANPVPIDATFWLILNRTASLLNITLTEEQQWYQEAYTYMTYEQAKKVGINNYGPIT